MKIDSLSWLRCLTLLVAIAFGSSYAKGDLVLHTSQSTFETSILGRARTNLNFDAEPYSTSASVFSNTISFSTNLNVTDGRFGFPLGTGDPASTVAGLNTHSGNNFLGTSITPVANLELISNSLTMNFSSPSTGIGFYVISFEALAQNEVSLRVGSSTVSVNANSPLELTAGGKTPSFAYFVGISDTNPSATFSTAQLILTPPPTGPIRVGIDSMIVAVPEPSSVAMCVLGIGAASLFGRRRRKTGLGSCTKTIQE